MNNETYVTIGWWLIGVLIAVILYLTYRYLRHRFENWQMKKHHARIQEQLVSTKYDLMSPNEARQINNAIHLHYERHVKSTDEWKQTIEETFAKIREQRRLDPIVAVDKGPFEQLRLPLDWVWNWNRPESNREMSKGPYKANRCHHEYVLSNVKPQNGDHYHFICVACLRDFPILKTDFWGPSRFERELEANIKRIYGEDGWYWSRVNLMPAESFVTIKDNKIVPLDLDSL